jgi:hypothetical protein
MRIAHMQEFKLHLVPSLADKLVVEHDHADERRRVERTEEPSPSIEAVVQNRRVFIGFAGRPSLDIDQLMRECESAIDKLVDAFDALAAIDTPNALDFVAAQFIEIDR